MMKADSKSQIQDTPTGFRYTAGLTLALILAVSGWGGLYYLVTHVRAPLPLAWTKAVIFLALWSVALMGTAWPVLLVISQRLGHSVPPARLWRQTGWVAMLGACVAWLQMNRALTLPLALTLAGAFALAEALLILRGQEDARGDKTKREET